MGGRILPLDYLCLAPSSRIREVSRPLDGARIFNAIVKCESMSDRSSRIRFSLGVPVQGFGRTGRIDTLGPQEFIATARRCAKRWRRHAPGRHSRAPRLVRARAPRRAVGGGSRQCRAPGRRAQRNRAEGRAAPDQSRVRGDSRAAGEPSARISRSAASLHRSARAPVWPLTSMRPGPRSTPRCARSASFPAGTDGDADAPAEDLQRINIQSRGRQFQQLTSSFGRPFAKSRRPRSPSIRSALEYKRRGRMSGVPARTPTHGRSRRVSTIASARSIARYRGHRATPNRPQDQHGGL